MGRRARGKQAKAYATLILLACCTRASALNPSLDINQYAHTTWKIRDGFSKGRITSFAQTPDGYLWLGTEFGLLRFDGVRNVAWVPPRGEHLPSGYIRSLLAARDGRLWVGTYKGLASWHDGKLTEYRELAGQTVDVILQDRRGTVWAGGFVGSIGRLCAIESGRAQCYGDDGGLGLWVASLYEDSRGNLWAGAQTGLWRWKPGPPKLYPMPDHVIGTSSQTMDESDDGALLIATEDGIKRMVDGKAEAYLLPGAAPKQFKALRMLRDRNGALWIGTTDRGLLHVHHGRTDVLTQSDGLSGDYINKFFEDREGNVWVATVNGLDRFREFAVPTLSVRQGLSNAIVWSVLGARDGSVWLGTPDGLNRWNNGQITIYRTRGAAAGSSGIEQARELNVREVGDRGLPDNGVESLFEDDGGRIWAFTERGAAYFENGRFIRVTINPAPVADSRPRQQQVNPVLALIAPSGQLHSIAGDGSGNLWISDQHQGLLHLLGGSVVERIPWAGLGRKDWAMALLAGPVPGGLWLGFSQGGVAYFKDGKVRESYSGGDGLGEGIVNSLSLDPDGTLWAATEGGLSRAKNGRVATLTSQNGLRCDTVFWVMQDDDHSFWLYTACGLVRIAGTEMDAWVSDPKRTVKNTVFDSSDGVRSRILTTGYTPLVAKTLDGKLWFLPLDGVSVIDPRHLPFNKLPPPVHIEQIAADRKTYWQNLSGDASAAQPRLPALVRDLTIDYTALSFVVPEKVRFRYKLEGQDPEWKEVVNDRSAHYSNLPPGNYRFRVTASNDSGVWNEAGDSFDFSIAPAYYQTAWFRVSCVAAFLVLLWALYRYRLHQIAQQFNTRLDERTRIARDLHDTLLQSFQGVVFRFQAVRNMLPRRPEEAMQALDTALERTDQALAEGRDAIQGLRASTMMTNELAQAVTALGEELASDSAKFHVVVQGPPQDLHPILRDEVYSIAREAVRNAFRHAQAHNIEVEITYSESSFQLRIRDDGKGIDSGIVAEGRAGHYGVPGMRERAKRIGGKLDVWTGTGAGTEIELSIPGSIAYGTSAGRGVLGLFRKARGREEATSG
jgi:signal transduction histidine kinase/ligand-binding sensor domain-containing protein